MGLDEDDQTNDGSIPLDKEESFFTNYVDVQINSRMSALVSFNEKKLNKKVDLDEKDLKVKLRVYDVMTLVFFNDSFSYASNWK